MVRREKLSQWKWKKFPNFFFFSIFELLQYAKLIENHQTQPGKQNKKKVEEWSKQTQTATNLNFTFVHQTNHTENKEKLYLINTFILTSTAIWKSEESG